VSFGDLEMIYIFAGEYGLRDLDSEARDCFGRTPMGVFEKERPKSMVEDAATYVQCRQAFIHLLSRTRNVMPERGLWDEEDEEDIFYDVEESTGSL